ncbi:MAG TPA: hypothetical protein VE076_01725 [Nitrososphaeraceae archaeon]|nr:hypothetical protein [Nitrososphaeraceae archaeon]
MKITLYICFLFKALIPTGIDCSRDLKIKHIRLKERYGEGEIPHEAKTTIVSDG